ncbi:MAG TPA: hypothetical protein VGX28_09165 [Frankiaceae bacterium]|nr:hypothetical protein [Frankiaceae bacterium]
MLRESWRHALAAARAASWRAPLLAVVSYVPLLALAPLAGGQLLVVGLVLHVIVLLALVRVLGAWRPAPLPPVPEVDEQGRRVAAPPRPGPPTTDADRGPATSLRNAWRLGRAAVSLTGLYLLAQVGAIATATALSGGRFLSDYSPVTQTMVALPVAALFLTFVALAPQRVALEGDPRVLVAAAHSVRIARSSYGVLLALTVVEPLVAVGVLLGGAGDDVPTGRAVAVAGAGLVAATVGKVLVTALSNELFLRGARLDLPLER